MFRSQIGYIYEEADGRQRPRGRIRRAVARLQPYCQRWFAQVGDILAFEGAVRIWLPVSEPEQSLIKMPDEVMNKWRAVGAHDDDEEINDLLRIAFNVENKWVCDLWRRGNYNNGLTSNQWKFSNSG